MSEYVTVPDKSPDPVFVIATVVVLVEPTAVAMKSTASGETETIGTTGAGVIETLSIPKPYQFDWE